MHPNADCMFKLHSVEFTCRDFVIFISSVVITVTEQRHVGSGVALIVSASADAPPPLPHADMTTINNDKAKILLTIKYPYFFGLCFFVLARPKAD